MDSIRGLKIVLTVTFVIFLASLSACSQDGDSECLDVLAKDEFSKIQKVSDVSKRDSNNKQEEKNSYRLIKITKVINRDSPGVKSEEGKQGDKNEDNKDLNGKEMNANEEVRESIAKITNQVAERLLFCHVENIKALSYKVRDNGDHLVRTIIELDDNDDEDGQYAHIIYRGTKDSASLVYIDNTRDKDSQLDWFYTDRVEPCDDDDDYW